MLPAKRKNPQSADFVAGLFGARGSGKSYTVKEAFRKRPRSRTLIWDTMDEYGDVARAVPSLGAMLEASSAQAFALRYVPRGTDKEIAARFGAFCAIAWDRGNLEMVVEELQRVTSPSFAPAEWADCTLRGRHRRLRIWGLSQRPASVDKNFFSNATYIRTGRLNYRGDVLCMADVLDVDRAEITRLLSWDFLGRDMSTGVRMKATPHADAAAVASSSGRRIPGGAHAPKLPKK